jgi:hypothetical protein
MHDTPKTCRDARRTCRNASGCCNCTHTSVRRVFPDTAPRLVYQIGPSLLPLRLSLGPACPSRPSGLPLSFALSTAACTLRSESETSARWSTTIRATYVAFPQGPSLQSGLCCPRPSSLIWSHPPHSPAHRNFTGLRFICEAFAVRERLEATREWFRAFTAYSFLACRPLSPRGAVAAHIQFLRDTRLPAPTPNRLGTPIVWMISGLTVLPLPRPTKLLASLNGSFYVQAFDGSVTLSAAGYHYGGNWIISTNGTFTRWNCS